MLDGLLGRNGFTSKCKSLIKPTRTRIAVLRRREEAKQRFLKEDLAKLLANGLDVNAYGRTEEFIAGLNLLCCYTFIDQSCEYMLKQLSVMQKLGQCPEECRETVASLMFAAARFSDLPELRDLRDVFQERYGNGLECYVNQAFVEKLASKPPVVEKRIKLLQDIAAELSIQWDSKGFKQRMDKPSTLAQKLGSTDDDYKPPNGNNDFRKNDQLSKERVEYAHQGPTLHDDKMVNIRSNYVLDGPVLRREEKHHKERIEHHDDRNVYGRRKEVSDIPNVETNKKNGYKPERLTSKAENGGRISNGNPDSNFENISGKNDRVPVVLDHDRASKGRKERHAYKHEPENIETIDNDVWGSHDRVPVVLDRDRVSKGRKERHAYKHEPENIKTIGNNDVWGCQFSRREEKHHKERIKRNDDGNAYGRRKEVLDIPYVEANKKHGYKHEILTSKHEPETIENNIFGNHDRGRKERHGYKHEPETIETRHNDDHLFRQRQEMRSPTSSRDRRPEVLTFLKGEKPDLPPHGKSRDKEDDEKSTGKLKEEDTIRSKSTYNSSLPPPYVKLNIPPPYSKPASNSEKMKKEADHQREEDLHYQNDIMQLPKPKSVRRRHKHSKSSSSHDDIGSSEDIRIVKRVSSSRRKDRKGLQILFDDEQYHSHRDDEEKMMDKLLLHYSKKPSAYDMGKLRKKKSRSKTNSKSPSLHDSDAEVIVPPTRSISLPHESGESEPKKVYARANSFQPDNQAKHVHPKLPDYDDLAARFAALRGR